MTTEELEKHYGPMRKLGQQEVVQAGDWVAFHGHNKSWELARGVIGHKVEKYQYEVMRPNRSNWIKFSDRKPTAEDGYYYPAGRERDRNYHGKVVVRFTDGSMGLFPWDAPNLISEESWMALSDPDHVKVEPIMIEVPGDGSREVVISRNGSVRVGCTTVSKEQMESIIKRWNETHKPS